MYRFLNCVIGQLKGYDRWRIRRQASAAGRCSPGTLEAQRQSLFQARVRDAIGRFPAYAQKVEACRGALPGESDTSRPEELPVWTREDQRALFNALDGPPVGRSFAHSTGGSTGVPLRFYVTRESYERRTAVSDYGYSLAGAEEGQKSFYVWGTPLDKPTRLQKLRFDIHHRLQRRVYFDSFHFSDEQKARCCRAIDRWQPRAIVGYTGNLVELARFARDKPRLLEWRSETIVTAAEGLHAGQRELLQDQLADEVFQSYGSREFMLIGMECEEHNGYHIMGTNLLVEVVGDDDKPLPPGETGRILITDLHNAANPFIRYEIGDLGAMAAPDYRCPCGRPFPVLERVDGRMQEIIQTPDGGKLTALFIPHLMKEFPWIEGYQIAQESDAAMVVHLLTTCELSSARTQPLVDALRKKVGCDMRIGFRLVNALQHNGSGKTPIVVTTQSSGA